MVWRNQGTEFGQELELKSRKDNGARKRGHGIVEIGDWRTQYTQISKQEHLEKTIKRQEQMRKNHEFLGPYTNIFSFPSRVCAHKAGLIRKYGLLVCRQVRWPQSLLPQLCNTFRWLLLANSASVKSPQTSASSSTDKRLAPLLSHLSPKTLKIKNYKFDFSAKEKSAHGMAWTDGNVETLIHTPFSQKNPSCARIWGFSLEWLIDGLDGEWKGMDGFDYDGKTNYFVPIHRVYWYNVNPEWHGSLTFFFLFRLLSIWLGVLNVNEIWSFIKSPVYDRKGPSGGLHYTRYLGIFVLWEGGIIYDSIDLDMTLCSS